MKLQLLAAVLALSPAAMAAPQEPSIQQESASREQRDTFVRGLLRKPLTVSTAVQIALANNKGLQAAYEEAGIARATVLDALSLPNPALDLEVLFPESGAQKYAGVIAQDFVRLLMLPAQRRMAEREIKAAELRTVAETLRVVEETKAAYFHVQAGQQLLSRLKIIQETSAAALELGQQQYKARSITDLDLLQLQAAYSQGRLDIAKAESEIAGSREELNRLLGLWGRQTGWRIEGDVMPIPATKLTAKGLESLAVAHRPDLQAAHQELSNTVAALGLTKTYRWLPVLEMGFSGEREPDGEILKGPEARIELPIFNNGRAKMQKAQAELRRAENHFEALAIDIRSEVRELRDRLESLREMARFHHDDVLPTRIRIVNKALLQYNAMQISSYDLFLSKSQELEAERDYIEVLRDYWITRAALERAVGGSLTATSRKESSK